MVGWTIEAVRPRGCFLALREVAAGAERRRRFGASFLLPLTGVTSAVASSAVALRLFEEGRGFEDGGGIAEDGAGRGALNLTRIAVS